MRLEFGDGKQQVHLRIHDIARPLIANLPSPAVDLIELATYVYSADQVCRRGGTASFDYGDDWRRRLRFHVPVRNPALWCAPGMRACLGEVLGFLSDDEYEFEFHQLSNPPTADSYLEFGKAATDPDGIEEVLLFSGGLDSFAGAVQEILSGHRKVALVSHQPTSKFAPVQRGLASDIAQAASDPRLAPLHVPVRINKGKALGKEYTQRTRSFLYAAVAAVAALALGRDRIRFYENGIVSLNLPISVQAVGGRATRTTHPRVLAGFASIFSRVFDRPFSVENPYLLKTKTDLLTQLKASGHAHLCARTVSCAHTWERTIAHSHCGRCSQCVDRRLVAVAAGFTSREDPPEMYKHDVLRDPCADVEHKSLVERYIGNARIVCSLESPSAFLARFGEAAKVLGDLGCGRDEAARRLFDLHKRHATQILSGLESVAAAEAASLVARTVPSSSALGIALGIGDGARAAETRSSAPPAPVDGMDLVVDSLDYTVSLGAAKRDLRSTIEFRLLAFFAQRPRLHRSHSDLRRGVWDGREVEPNTIHKTVSKLNRRFRTREFKGVRVRAVTRSHYFLELPAGVTVKFIDRPGSRPENGKGAT